MRRSRVTQACLAVAVLVLALVLSSCGGSSSSAPSANTLVQQGLSQLASNPQGHYKLSLLAQATIPAQGGLTIEGGTIQKGAEKTLSVSGEATGAYGSGELTASGNVSLLGRSISGSVAVKGHAIYVEYGGKWYGTTDASSGGAESAEIGKLKAELQGQLGKLKSLDVEKLATSSVAAGSGDTWVVTLHPKASGLSSLLGNFEKESSAGSTGEESLGATGEASGAVASQLGQLGKMLGGVLSQVASDVTLTMTFHQGSNTLESVHFSWQQPSLNFLIQIKNIDVQVNVQVLNHNAPAPFTPPANYLPLQGLEKVASETTSGAGLPSL